MKIKVTRGWGTGYSHRVKPGEYDIEDPALLGKGRYLIAEGFAEIIKEDKPAFPVETVKAKPKAKRASAKNIVESKGGK